MKQFIFGFIIGGSLAGVSTYFITKYCLEEKYKKQYEEEAVKARNYYMDYFSPKKVSVVKEEPEEIVKKYHEEAERYFGDSITREPVDPAELEGPEDDAPEEYYEEIDPIEEKHKAEAMRAYEYDQENRRRAPERITPDEFGQAPGYESKEYTYYAADRTFCDEFENMIDDEVSMFGADIVDWQDNDDDEDFIYIRNYQLECDFKIEKLMCNCPQNPKM